MRSNPTANATLPTHISTVVSITTEPCDLYRDLNISYSVNGSKKGNHIAQLEGANNSKMSA